MRERVHVLHIGKTAGTALGHTLVEHAHSSPYELVFGGHELTLADVPRGEKAVVTLRDPLSRYVSAFNGRLREDRPRYHYPWTDEERLAFERFTTPDELGVALSARNPLRRRRAERAMRGIGHVKTSYRSWLGDERQLREREDDLFFIAFVERLDDDFELLKRKLGFPAEARLPADDTVAHRTPADFTRDVSPVAQQNLSRWYAEDLALVELCRELAARVNLSDSPG
jgi:hypothetical protein